jgi:hypothetical protein
MMYGFLDALWQTYAYYTMGAMSNDPRKLAYYAGFYKSIQAVGATTITALDADKYPFISEFASSWALMAGALICALPVFIWRIKDTEIMESDTEDFAEKTVVGSNPMAVSGMAAELGDHEAREKKH